MKAYIKVTLIDDFKVNDKKVFKFEDVLISKDAPPFGYTEAYSESVGLLNSFKENKDLKAYIVCDEIERHTSKDIFPVWHGYVDVQQIKRVVGENYAKRKIEDSFGSNLSAVMNLFKYLNLLTKFAEYGIFINDKNREEQYIEIINRENPELLDHLQEYLDMREYIHGSLAQYDQYLAIINRTATT
jgi:hypothetical protein